MGRFREAAISALCLTAIGALLVYGPSGNAPDATDTPTTATGAARLQKLPKIDLRMVLDQPGAIGEIKGRATRVKAFFQTVDGSIQLTVYFVNAKDNEDLFSASVKLKDRQSHAIEVGGDDDGKGADKYLFVRDGARVDVRVIAPPARIYEVRSAARDDPPKTANEGKP